MPWLSAQDLAIHPDYSTSSFRDNRHDILVRYNMTQSDSLRYVSCTGSPNHGIFEGLLQRPMDLVAYFFDGGLISDNEGFAKVWVLSFSIRSSARINL